MNYQDGLSCLKIYATTNEKLKALKTATKARSMYELVEMLVDPHYAKLVESEVEELLKKQRDLQTEIDKKVATLPKL